MLKLIGQLKDHCHFCPVDGGPQESKDDVRKDNGSDSCHIGKLSGQSWTEWVTYFRAAAGALQPPCAAMQTNADYS